MNEFIVSVRAHNGSIATPEMVRKEMWTCLLAYNLIRQTMLQSAQKAGVSPRTLSFTAAVQSIAASWMVIVLSDDALATLLIDAASVSLAEHVVGNRPGRLEPRAQMRFRAVYLRGATPTSGGAFDWGGLGWYDRAPSRAEASACFMASRR